MNAFRLFALMFLAAIYLMASTNCATLTQGNNWRLTEKVEKYGEVNVTISIPEFIQEFEKLQKYEQKIVLEFFKEHTKPFGFSWKECFPYFSSDFRLPGCPPPPPSEGCPIPPKGCRAPPPAWYCPKHEKSKNAIECPKPPPKPPICKPWQKGFYHRKPEYEHV